MLVLLSSSPGSNRVRGLRPGGGGRGDGGGFRSAGGAGRRHPATAGGPHRSDTGRHRETRRHAVGRAPAQAEQFTDRRGSPVRSQYHQAKCTTGKDDLPRRLHRGSRVSAVRTGCETHGRHGAQRAVTLAGDRRQRGSTVTCRCSTRRRAVSELRRVGPRATLLPSTSITTHPLFARNVVTI
jgi:hypothetical protein